MNTTYRYLLGTIIRHVTVVGLTYLALRYAIQGLEVTHSFVICTSILFAPIAFLWLLRIRPVPQNPIQGFVLNTFILLYGGATALPAAFMLCIAVHPSVALLLLIGYSAVIGYCCVDGDQTIHHSPTKRKMSFWQREIRQHRSLPRY